MRGHASLGRDTDRRRAQTPYSIQRWELLMPTRLRRWTTAVLALVALAVATATSAANTITAVPSGAITQTSQGKVRITGRGGIEIGIECRVTLSGSFNETIHNEFEGLLGSLTSGRANECGFLNGMTFEFRASWPIRLATFASLERAPDLIWLTLNGFKFTIVAVGIPCTFQGSPPSVLEGEGTPVVTRRIAFGANSFTFVSGHPELCPPEASLTGRFNITTQTLRL